MENYGLITIDQFLNEDIEGDAIDNLLLWNHEIAHQWFGDLVTMRSWKDM